MTLHNPRPRHQSAAYIADFHAQQPGITERILRRCRSEGTDPYTWCAGALGRTGERTLDVACGSGPLAALLSPWIGLDLSAEELAAAAAAGRRPLVRASATALPMRDKALNGVVCSMALQVIDPVDRAFAEIARVLRPGGRAVALLPASGPVGAGDALVYARLQATLQARISYPNSRRLRSGSLAKLAQAAGLTVAGDTRRAFGLPLRTEADVAELLSSLYLPEVSPERVARAQRFLRTRVGHDLAVPLRRVVLQRKVQP